jgi:beta-galactosidase
VSPDIPQYPFGAVYFRKSNPPREDWERDYRTASEDGSNIFRHWFLWSAIEVAPGEFDWEEYDRQLDLAAKHGIRTIVAEHITNTPEWLAALYPNAVLTSADGKLAHGSMNASSATGSTHLCLDCPEVKEHAGRFLSELGKHYKGHPGLLGYDVMNEMWRRECYCPYSAARFRIWLQEKYGDLKTLAQAWRRHSYTDWSQVMPPHRLEMYTESLDWVSFVKDSSYEDFEWRIDVLRAADPDALITAHGTGASINNYEMHGSDEWRAAAPVDVYGFTHWAGREDSSLWKHMHCVDVVRAGAGGKPFWHAELQGGPFWASSYQRWFLKDRAKDDGRLVTPEDVRLIALTSMAGGTRGILSPRWRALLDGPLFGCFGFYNNDGSRSGRSEVVSKLAQWSNAEAQRGLFTGSSPVKGEIGLLITDESLAFNYISAPGANPENYDPAMSGAYKAFFDNNIQADWVPIDDIDQWDFLYYAYPFMLSHEHAEKLIAWVENGGTLVSQGCPGYFDENCHLGTVQPNMGLDKLFGAREEYVELLPEVLDDVMFDWEGRAVHGGLYYQTYQPTTGTVKGRYPDGTVAVVEHTYGQGRTLLIGTYPSVAYYKDPTEENRRFFQDILSWGGVEQAVRVSQIEVTARLFDGKGGCYLWIINPAKQDLPVQVDLLHEDAVEVKRVVWGDVESEVTGNSLMLTVPSKDAVVVELG